MKKLNILVVDDERAQREMLSGFLKTEGHFVGEAPNGEKAIQSVREGHYDLVLLDYKMPKMDGMEVLRSVKQINPEIDVVIITAFGKIETAVDAMKAGALDYITKPVEFEELLILVERVSERRTLIRENEILREHLGQKGISTDKIVFCNAKMGALINMAGRVAGSKATILLQGESGTGKELFARLIHNLSPRSEKQIIAVNCGALNENLLESELFGHEKGAFTGATARRIGRFEEAEGGTLFLDEVGELSPQVQVKLLRFLQEREFQRLGGNQILHADVRVISATNRDLEEAVKAGTFREDLYYRLNVVAMSLPPLRERKDDIQPLIDHFLARYAKENAKEIRDVSFEARDMLLKYDYPGNVRELENIIERAVVIVRGNVISIEDLPFREGMDVSAEDKKEDDGVLRRSMEELEKKMIVEALEKSGGHQSRAAVLLGISERMLRYKLKKYGWKSDQ